MVDLQPGRWPDLPPHTLKGMASKTLVLGGMLAVFQGTEVTGTPFYRTESPSLTTSLPFRI